MDSDRVRPPVAERVARGRSRSGLTASGIANLLGLSVAAYEDLESYDDELFMCISLGQLVRLAQLLGVPPRELVAADGDDLGQSEISMPELVSEMRSYMSKRSVSVDQFEDQIGWKIRDVLMNPSAGWDALNVDALKGVCAPIGRSWLAVLPIAQPNPALQRTASGGR